MSIELVITDETPQPAPGLSDEDILDCFLAAPLDGSYRKYLVAAGRAIEALLPRFAGPIDMVLNCPRCGVQHIDEMKQCAACNGYDPEGNALCPQCWQNPPHRSHLCGECGWIWRPADVPTNGVAAVATRGAKDSA